MVGNLPKGERFAKTGDSTPCCCSYEAISVRKLLFMCRLRPEKKKELKKHLRNKQRDATKELAIIEELMLMMMGYDGISHMDGRAAVLHFIAYS